MKIINFSRTIAYRLAAFEGRQGCWEWMWSKNPAGYGLHQGKAAHRKSYEHFKGAIPDGLVIDHTCRNRCCVNPEHLRAVTQGVNSVENSVSVAALNKAKTHCPRGHAYTDDNIGKFGLPTQRGRYCKRCRADIEVTRHRRKRMEKLGIKFDPTRVDEEWERTTEERWNITMPNLND